MRIFKSFLLILCFVIPGVLSRAFSFHTLSKSLAEQLNCQTNQCEQYVKELEDQLSPEIDPCDNFYDYVCRKKLTKIEQQMTEFPNASIQSTTYGDLQILVNSQLHAMLKEEPNKTDTITKKSRAKSKLSFESAQKYYRNCMIQLQQWPFITGNHSGYDWTQDLISSSAIDYEIDWILKLKVIENEQESSSVLEIEEPSFIFNRTLLRNPTNENKAKLFGDLKKAANLTTGFRQFLYESALSEIIDFEIGLIKLMKTDDEFVNNGSVAMKYSSVKRRKRPRKAQELSFIRTPVQFIWNKLSASLMTTSKRTINSINKQKYTIFEPKGFAVFSFNRLYGRNSNGISEFLRHIKMPVSNRSAKFLNDLDNYMRKIPKRVLRNYMVWRMRTNEKISKARKLKETMFSQFSDKPDGQQCLILTKKSFPLQVTEAYVNRYLDNDSVKIVRTMFENIKAVFEKVVMETDWLDDQSKEAVLLKLRKIKAVIGKFNAEDIDFSKVARKEARIRRIYEKMTEANALFIMDLNVVVIPAAIIRGKMFDKNLPMIFNYASIGRVIGHEIGHAFDGGNFLKDENGNLVSKWSIESIAVFRAKEKRIIEQYSNFLDLSTGLKIRGKKTKYDDMADHTGVVMAYLTYQMHKNDITESLQEEQTSIEETGEADDLVLDNHEIEKNQLFWIKFADMSCSYVSRSLMRNIILYGTHSPFQFRTIGPLQNTEYFAKDFQCALDTYMNPSDKNIIWG